MAFFHKGFIKAHPLISVILYVLRLYLAFSTVIPSTTAIDPCNNYTVLDNPWRSVSNGRGSMCDTSVSWSGWYRLFINGLNAHIPDTCVARYRCGTDVPLWIRGGHPTVTDGVVTRDVCGNWNNFCCYYGSYPIKVKACPGDYYVYELVRTTFCYSAYCADTGSINTSPTTVTPVTISPDPCNTYTVLDNPWRSINNTNAPVRNCDTSVSWSGWYRLFINNVSAHIPDTCVTLYRCGTDYPLWIRGGHPTVTDGVVTRDVCSYYNNFCCYHGSYPIKVKACPGDYYVYELVRPTICNSAYCADTDSINTNSTSVTPVTISTDPCNNYTVLNDTWRSTSNTYASVRNCDTSVSWSGWYRLFINNISAHIPDTCVARSRCGTDVALWIRGGHPTVTDGVVTREVCGYYINFCCYFGSYPIKVKACPGDYYVYELVRPTLCDSAYCADTGSINTSPTTVTPVTISSDTGSINTSSTTVTPVTISPASSNTTVYILYAVCGLFGGLVIILLVGLIVLRKTSAKTGSVTPVKKQNESRDEQKSNANDFEDGVYENDKSTHMKPINRPKVPKSQEHTVYGNIQP